ncbi:Cinnamoyl-CoA reductase 1 [Camellia lanceoleosa]|uniref:Cinnamoyl-CoA reductase 1 n=1 Tax=Camellia lanceoleosa TaxID=1840588 RepID=A0ACC0F679_9ERIC|nr:Cinnamoyl-CoA reductase 1 [Camellia lanceoleosa]
MSGVGKTVCVTGASEYIASWLVKLLLQRGYAVKASVRDPSDPKKTEHLLALEGAKERLHLTKANLLEEGCFDSLVDGCEGVFHTASPFYHDVKDPQVELIDPALKGTLNVLGSCAKNLSVKRVVLTSSVAAVAFNGRPLSPDVVVDESWFYDPSSVSKISFGMSLSKTLAEDLPKFTKGKGIDMVTINPKNGYRSSLVPNAQYKSSAILNLINGSQTFPNSTFGWVNVKDVANAHIQAFEIPSANGRYCLVEIDAHLSEVVKILQEFLAFQLREKCADDKPFTPTYQVSKERTKSLGIEFIPLKQSIKETVESLKEKKLFTWRTSRRLRSRRKDSKANAGGEVTASPYRCWAGEIEKSEAEMRWSVEELRRKVGERDEMLNFMARKSKFRRRWRK